MLTSMVFGLLTFFPRTSGRIKLVQPEYCKAKVSEREISRLLRSKVMVTLQFYKPKRFKFYYL